jgi:hypothetical protein
MTTLTLTVSAHSAASLARRGITIAVPTPDARSQFEQVKQWLADHEATIDYEQRVTEGRPYEDAVSPEEFDRRYPSEG